MTSAYIVKDGQQAETNLLIAFAGGQNTPPVNRCTAFILGFLKAFSCGLLRIFWKFGRIPLIFVLLTLGSSVFLIPVGFLVG